MYECFYNILNVNYVEKIDFKNNFTVNKSILLTCSLVC